MVENKKVVGIDLGTTNSVVATIGGSTCSYPKF